MDTKILLPKQICEDDVVAYIARRYNATPLAVITSFLQHEGIRRRFPLPKPADTLIADFQRSISGCRLAKDYRV